ncbi:MAG: NlpC/P60 family protein [Sciscionella sp.]
MSGVLAAAAVLAAIGFGTAQATADPSSAPAPPTTAAGALSQYKHLADQAEKVNEDYLKAKSDLAARKAQLRSATATMKKAKAAQQLAAAKEEQFRSQVDKLSGASMEGAQFSQLSALVTGESPHDFLDRASALQVLSEDNNRALQRLSKATNAADDAGKQASAAQRSAKDATNAANQLIADIQKRNTALQQQISVVQTALNKLSASDRSSLGSKGDMGVFIAPPGIAGQAMELALGQRGSNYVWGGATPGSFDCSGLVEWAYGKLGVSLPHSSQAQSQIGEAIPRNALQPGDLVFFGSPAHHVGIYVGGGKMVDAPDFGQVVKVEPLDRDYSGARRISS